MAESDSGSTPEGRSAGGTPHASGGPTRAERRGTTRETSTEDETKRKFREALERKKARTASAGDHKDAGLKQPTPHGPVEHRREFRRKSG